jgi:hypothetical protein
MPTSAADLKRWIANHEAASSRVREERRLLTPTESLQKAMQVSELQRQVSGSPQATSIDDVLVVHRQWDKLRSALLATHRV